MQSLLEWAELLTTNDLMKTLSILVLGLLSLLPLSAQDAEKKKLTPAERLLKVTKFANSGQAAASAAFKPVIENFRTQGYPDKAIKEIEAAASAYFHQMMTDPGLQKDVVNLYNESFTAEELETMLAFYETPTGQKALQRMPQIVAKSMTLGQKYAEKYAPDFQNQLQKILEKYADKLEQPEE